MSASPAASWSRVVASPPTVAPTPCPTIPVFNPSNSLEEWDSSSDDDSHNSSSATLSYTPSSTVSHIPCNFNTAACTSLPQLQHILNTPSPHFVGNYDHCVLYMLSSLHLSAMSTIIVNSGATTHMITSRLAFVSFFPSAGGGWSYLLMTPPSPF